MQRRRVKDEVFRYVNFYQQGSACTYNPAKALWCEDQVGSIETGKVADFLVIQGNYEGKRVFLAGKEI